MHQWIGDQREHAWVFGSRNGSLIPCDSPMWCRILKYPQIKMCPCTARTASDKLWRGPKEVGVAWQSFFSGLESMQRYCAYPLEAYPGSGTLEGRRKYQRITSTVASHWACEAEKGRFVGLVLAQASHFTMGRHFGQNEPNGGNGGYKKL